MKKIIVLLLIYMIKAQIFAIAATDCNIFVKQVSSQTNSVKYDVTIVVKNGWKLTQKPSISPLNLKNPKYFIYSEKGIIEKVNETTYKTNFIVLKSDIENQNTESHHLELLIQCPLCKDVCVLVSKNIIVDMDNTKDTNSFWLTILLAIVGGLLLNIMPCVLPVILLKIRSFLHNDTVLKRAFLGSILGNYFVFFFLSIVIAFFKITGESLGWGMHFQNANFLKILVVVLFLLTLYSFEIIRLHPSIQIKNVKNRAFAGNFISSIVASIVALPCTAPLLGTAATFAMIEASISEMFVIFFAISTGFSLPYIAVLVFSYCRLTSNPTATIFVAPAFLKKFSNIIKKIANFGVLVTFLWMFLMLSNHFDILILTILVIFFLLASLLFWKNKNFTATIVVMSILLLPLGSQQTGYLSQNRKENIKTQNIDEIWRKHTSVLNVITPELIHSRIVLLNISADWCMTCKFNKINALNDKKVKKFLNDNNVLCIEGDMTRKNDELMEIIRKHNRIGIPFTIVYGPNAPEGILLSEVLSAKEIIIAIENAK